MTQKLFSKTEFYMEQKSRRRILKRIVRFLACLIVFCTTYALILPAITKEHTYYCGQEIHEHTDECYILNEHVHDASCYSGIQAELWCSLTEDSGHQHGEDCYW